MQRLPRFTILLLLAAAFLAFSATLSPLDGEEPRKVKVRDYSVMIPGHMVVTTELNEEASLQYQNIYRELYIIVIDEPKDAIIEMFTEQGNYDTTKSPVTNYRIFQVKDLRENLLVIGEPLITKATINGLEAEIASFHATLEGVPYEVFYQAVFYEGKENFYFLSTWTLASEKEKNKKEMEEMIYSFSATN